MAKSRRERRLRRLQEKKQEITHLQSEIKDFDESKESDESSSKTKSTHRNIFAKLYDKQYKKLVLIPILLLIFAFIVIGINIANTGDFMNKAVSLKGGITLTVPLETEVDITILEQTLRLDLPDADISIRGLSEFGVQRGIIVESAVIDESVLLNAVKEAVGNFGDSYSIETIGSSLGESFFSQTMFAMILAFIFMGVVVYLYFRTLIPSAAVILAAFSDIVITIAIVDILGMQIGAAGIAAFLMLIGYSVDTDILLSTRVLKKKEGTVLDRVYGAMKTGLTMNLTTIVAITLGLIVTQSDVIRQIMLIILIGLLVDIINTWLENVAIIRYYLEKKGIK